MLALSCGDNILIILKHMGHALLAFLFVALTAALSPVILITPENHQAVLNSQQLLQFLARQPTPIVAQLGAITEADLASLRSALKALPIDKQRVSSFLLASDSLHQLKTALTALHAETKTLQISQILALLDNQTKPVIITADLTMPSTPRLLQTFNNTVQSKIFTNMTSASLSGLWVGLFLLVMLGIAISCLFDLKTHEKFARQNLWVGRES